MLKYFQECHCEGLHELQLITDLQRLENLTTGVQMLQSDTAANHKQKSTSYDHWQDVLKKDFNEHKRNKHKEQQPAAECMVSKNVQFVQGLWNHVQYQTKTNSFPF